MILMFLGAAAHAAATGHGPLRPGPSAAGHPLFCSDFDSDFDSDFSPPPEPRRSTPAAAALREQP